jgi:uncharacterized hydrophobic protein (TIGR00271 family)
MLQLRVYGDQVAMRAVAQDLSGLAGVRHLHVTNGVGENSAAVTADVRADAADAALSVLERRSVPEPDFVFARLDTIGALSGGSEPLAIVWADVLGRARIQARAPGRYFVLMAAAGVVAAFAVLNRSPVLIVGAMAISPDLLPIAAACTGLVLRRPRLVLRGLGTLFAGFALTWLVAAAVTGLLNAFDQLPDGFQLGEIPASQTHVGASTIAIALAAGVAGILSVETRASSAVGVAISVTTIPSVAYLGVALGIGELGKSLSAISVLLVNVAMMFVGGSIALAAQRAAASSAIR